MKIVGKTACFLTRPGAMRSRQEPIALQVVAATGAFLPRSLRRTIMKLAPLTAAAAVALIMTAALSSPAAACKWKKAGYHGYRTADAGAVRGWKHRGHWKHHKRWRHESMK
jgi:hypothetical protein